MRKPPILLFLGALAFLACLAWLSHRRAAPKEVAGNPEPSAASAISTPAAVLPAKPLPAAPLPPSREDLAQASTLDSVLATHNDNDPRLDRELKDLSEPAKALFQKKYQSIPAEKRNELGTIVFLLGRNLRSAGDLDFMEQVINSPPCRSLANCAADAARVEAASMHAEAGMEVSLAYPQIVALKSLERILEAGPGNPLYQRAWDTVNAAAHSSVPKVAQVAQAIQSQHRQ